MDPEILPGLGSHAFVNAGTPGPLEAVALGARESDCGLRASAPALSRALGVLQVSAHASVVGRDSREEYVRIVDAMGQKLRAAQYNGSYFDRGADAGSRLCTREGWFSCQVSCALYHGAT